MSCPICQKPAAPPKENRFSPFCCEHCKLVDLSKWMGEEYRIAGAPAVDTEAQSPPDPRDREDGDDGLFH